MDAYINSQFPGARDTFELKSAVSDLIPLTNYKIGFVQGNSKCWVADVMCHLKLEENIGVFIDNYLRQNNETLKIVTKKQCGIKSSYVLNNFYRCHHDTRYPPTRNVTALKGNMPIKRIKNTSCSFVLNVKILKVFPEFPCIINIEWNHNHPINSLEALNFKSLRKDVIAKVDSYFAKGYTPSLAYCEFLNDLRRDSDTDLSYHFKKADRSLCPRRRDFNTLYRKYCDGWFGGKNGSSMLSELLTNLQNLRTNGLNVDWQLYDSVQQEPLVIVFVTPLMERVHRMVIL